MGRQADFLLSAGGFHPRFPPPAGFPELRRIGASLVRGGLSLRLEAYLALTSNTFQLGAHVDVGYTGFGFVVRGTCGFDALVQFSPFHFEVDIDASVSVSWHGFDLLAVRLHLGLSGRTRGTRSARRRSTSAGCRRWSSASTSRSAPRAAGRCPTRRTSRRCCTTRSPTRAHGRRRWPPTSGLS